MNKKKKEIITVFSIVSVFVIVFMYLLIGTNLILRKDRSILEMKPKYTCPEDYYLKKDKCYSKNEIEMEKPSCDEGKLTGSVCIVRKTSDKLNGCKDKDQDVGTGCESILTTKADKKYSCEEGYVLSGDKCLKKLGNPLEKKAECPKGSWAKPTSPSGVSCLIKSEDLPEGKTECEAGKTLNPDDKKCYFEEQFIKNEYSCEKGELLKDACYEVKAAIAEYTCKADYKLHKTLPGTCEKKEKYKYISKCPNGYIEDIDGEKCILDKMEEAKIVKSCTKKDGYARIGGVCHKVIKPQPKCKKGYVYYQNKCVKDV